MSDSGNFGSLILAKNFEAIFFRIVHYCGANLQSIMQLQFKLVSKRSFLLFAKMLIAIIRLSELNELS